MIPVADKVRLIEALAETGLKHIACVSYVNPKRVPTMADAEQVAAAIHRKPGIHYSALYLNQQGLERALRGPLDVEGSVRITASETFSRKNIRSEERRVGKECRSRWEPEQKTAYEMDG